MGRRDKEIIETTCSICNVPIQIKYGTYRKAKGQPHLCRACRGKQESERIKALPEKERIAYLSNKNSHISGGWKVQSQERKAQISADRKEAWANNTERKIAHCERMSQRWNNMSDERKQQQVDALLKGQVEFWADEENYNRMAKEAHDRWYSQSTEEQKRILDALESGRLKYLANVTPEQLEEVRRKKSEAMTRYWAQFTREEILEKMQPMLKAMERNFLTGYNKNELAFTNQCDLHGIKYERHWVNKTKHPDFDKLFPTNPTRGGMMVMWSHTWDVIVHTLNGDVLIDIDGSIHNPKCNQNLVHDKCGNRFVLGDYINFNDSKRPYQTDGLSAYIVQCWDDNLNPHTPVLELSTGKLISFHDLMMTLQWMCQTDKEIKKVLKMAKK